MWLQQMRGLSISVLHISQAVVQCVCVAFFLSLRQHWCFTESVHMNSHLRKILHSLRRYQVQYHESVTNERVNKACARAFRRQWEFTAPAVSATKRSNIKRRQRAASSTPRNSHCRTGVLDQMPGKVWNHHERNYDAAPSDATASGTSKNLALYVALAVLHAEENT